MKIRIEKLQEKLRSQNLDALLISNFYNIAYLSGFSGVDPSHREAFFVASQDNCYLLTNALYSEEARNLFAVSCSLFAVIEINQEKKLQDRLLEIIKKEKIKKLAFEKYDLKYAEVEKFKKDSGHTSTTQYKARMTQVTLVPTENLVEDLRMIKDKTEIDAIKKACKLTDETFSFIVSYLSNLSDLDSLKETELAWEIEKYIRENGGQLAFSPIVAFGTHSSMPHYIPKLSFKDSQSLALEKKDMILLDFGAKIDGYCADMTRMIFVGNPTEKQKKMYQTVLSAQEKALEKLKKGNRNGQLLDTVAREVIEKSGYQAYPHSLGHGVGREIHEGFRLIKHKKFLLKPGMVFSIEPGYYEPGWSGIRIEDLVVLKEDGIEILTQSSKEIITIKL